MDDPYHILGIKNNATEMEIKKRYRFLVKAYHPDRYSNSQDKKQAEEELKKINIAYFIIGDTTRKNDYDKTINNDPTSEDELSNIWKYLKDSLEKWKSIVDKRQFSEFDKQTISAVRTKMTSCFNNRQTFASNDEIRNQINTQLILLISINLAIGLEKKRNESNFNYPEEKLINYSTVYIFQLFNELLHKNISKDQLTNENLKTLDELPNHLLNLAIYFFDIGYGFEDSSYQTTNYQETSGNSQPNNTSKNKAENYCDECNNLGIVMPATYRKNIGMVILRKYSETSGKFCPTCHQTLFWKAFLSNIFLGWWGVISLVINPFLIILNIANYIKSWKIRGEENGIIKNKLDWKLLSLISVIIIIPLIIFNSSSTQELISHNDTVRDAGESFMTALKKGDHTTSWNMLTPAVQEELGSQEFWVEWASIRNFPEWKFTNTEVENNEGQLDGEATLDGITYDVTLVFEKIGDAWLISGINFQNQ